MDGVVNRIDIGGRAIGSGCPCFIIAEAGVNHNGEIGLAKRLIDAAAEAGVDAVKFQTFKAGRIVTEGAPKAAYQAGATGSRESQRQMLRRLELSEEAHRELRDCCRERRLVFLSTPFDEESADFLEALGVPLFKIPSGELTNLPFLAHVARKGRPMIVSTGMATLEEVRQAVRTVKEAGAGSLVLLHCVSTYPAEPDEVNLRAMRAMAEAFGVPVGYSDHTMGIEVALAAAALGAAVIEKHVTMDRRLPGPDQACSCEPDELVSLVRGVRKVERALGHGRKEPVASEAETAAAARKSLVAARDIPAGSVLTDEMLAAKRPGIGLAPALREQIIGKRVTRAVPAGTLLTPDMFA